MLAVLLFVHGSQAVAAESLSVGTIERPPFSYHTDDDQLTGFAVELLREIASLMKVEYTWVRHEQYPTLIESVSTGATDLAIANISITSAREQLADYSQPIFESGMSIAVNKGSSSNFFQLIWESGILWFLGGALLLVFVIANVIWFFERGIVDGRHDYFRDDYVGGVWDAFWWAFVIMTMGGFEKEVPHKIINRLLAMFWIIVSLFFISTLTAKITTSLTIAELKTGIESYRDLAGKKVGVTLGSSHQRFLDAREIDNIAFATIDEMYAALKAKQIEAVVGDYPILSYYAQRDGADWMILTGDVFSPENYGILAPEDSPHLEGVNNALLQLREEGRYEDIYAKYFGMD